jgi:hypothetical protein
MGLRIPEEGIPITAVHSTLYPACCYYSNVVYRRIEAYLEEKGVDFEIGSFPRTPKNYGGLDANKPQYASEPGDSVSLIMSEVPTKMYHHVIVPGLRQLCAEGFVNIVPVLYSSDAKGCHLAANLFFKPTTIPQWVVDKAGY